MRHWIARRPPRTDEPGIRSTFAGARLIRPRTLRLTRLALTACALAVSAGCTRSRCINEATVGLPSPDGAMIAFIFSRRCTGDPSSTDVSVFPMNTSLHGEAGNVLVAPGNQPVKVAWHGPRRLAVSGFADPSFRLDRPLGDVSVEFPQAPSTSAAGSP